MGSAKYKIGIDCRMFSDSFTGIGRYNYELTKRLFSQTEINGKPVEWVIFMNEPEAGNFSFPDHVKKVSVNARHYTFREQWAFWRILMKEKCDLVHFTHFNLPFLYRRKFVVTIHDTTISFFPGKKMNVWWRKMAYRLVFGHAVKSSAGIITVSKNTKLDVVKLYPGTEEKITVIWNGLGKDFVSVDIDEQLQVSKRYDLSDRFLLYTGVWREHKNLVGLIKSFALISKNNPDLNLVITGKEDPYYPEVKTEVINWGLEDKVKFVGLVPFHDLVALYNAAEIFVFPSFYEGFGFPPLEAMLVSTPVCASESASIPEVCGEAALYFDPTDIEDMAQKVEMLLLDENLKSSLIEKGLKQTSLFSWDTCSKATLNSYIKYS